MEADHAEGRAVVEDGDADKVGGQLPQQQQMLGRFEGHLDIARLKGCGLAEGFEALTVGAEEVAEKSGHLIGLEGLICTDPGVEEQTVGHRDDNDRAQRGDALDHMMERCRHIGVFPGSSTAARKA